MPVTECYSATNNILAKQNGVFTKELFRIPKRASANGTLDPCIARLLSITFLNLKFLVFISELPTLMLIACNLRNCCRVPIIVNSVLSSLTRSLSWISQLQIFLMQHCSNQSINQSINNLYLYTISI